MILGIGIDLIKVERVGRLYLRYKDSFIHKILSPYEIKKIRDITSTNYAIQYLAKRFVAKEALVKAIGTGFGEKASMRDITVKNDTRGKPYYDLTIGLDGVIKELFKIKKYSLHLSISDDKENAVANALIETADEYI